MKRFWLGALVSVTLLLMSVALLGIAPVSAQTINWSAEFFNNPNYNFTGSPVLTRVDPQLSFVWNNVSPGGSVNIENWSARWTATIPLNTATYRFALRADRSARLYVNNSLLINLDNVTAGTTVAADIALAAGNIPLRVEYYNDTGSAFLAMNFALASTVSTATPLGGATATPTGSTGGGGTTTNKWSASYYANTDLSGSPALTATVSSPSFNYGTGSPGANVPSDGFSARFSATENFTAGVYRFDVSADDGVRVTVGGQRIIDHWYVTDSNLTYTANVSVSGPTSVTVEYFENALGASLFYSVARAPDGTAPSTSFGSSDPRQTVAQQQNYAIYATARIITGRLNVREQPSLGSRIITKVNFGEYYNVIGTNADRSWYQIQIGNLTGWAAGTFLRIESQGSVAQTAPTNSQMQVDNPYAVPPNPLQPAPVSAPSATGISVMTTANVIIRNQPTAASGRGGIVPANTFVEILGRNSTNTWWYVNFSYQEGWINSAYTVIQPNVNINAVPVLAQ